VEGTLIQGDTTAVATDAAVAHAHSIGEYFWLDLDAEAEGEVVSVVVDLYQNRGIGTLLPEPLRCVRFPIEPDDTCRKVGPARHAGTQLRGCHRATAAPC
jgi:hypothetical protein